MVLVDTSVWIDFFAGRNTPYRHELHRLIANGAELAVSGIIVQEILQGIRSVAQVRQVHEYLAVFDYVTLVEPDIFVRAAEVYRTCAAKGKTIRKPIDCLIAAQALAADIPLLHHDRDFDHIAQCHPLRVHAVTV